MSDGQCQMDKKVIIFETLRRVNLLHTVNPLSAKLTKWPNTLKQFVGNLPTNCLSMFGHFVGLALEGLKRYLSQQSFKLCNIRYMIASTQITNAEIFVFIAVLVFQLLDRKVLCINRKDNRNC